MTVTIGRRELLVALGGAAAWPLAARAQQPERMRRIGIVMPFVKGDSEGEARIRAFKQELAKLGWTDGGNIQFDERWPADNMDLVRSHAASLVASKPDIIIASGGRIVPVLMRLTRSIPMVLPGASDPVGCCQPGRRSRIHYFACLNATPFRRFSSASISVPS